MAQRSGEREPAGRCGTQGARRGNWALILLILPFVALLYPPFYASLEPKVGGIPFFVWYQFLWVLLGSAITAVVYRIRRTED